MNTGDRFFDVEEDPDQQFVRVTRTRVPYDTLADVHTAFRYVLDELDEIDREVYGLIIDFRDGPPPRNDDAFERVTREYRPRLYENFAGAVVLVRTMAGMLQLSRNSAEDKQAFKPFDDPLEAEAYLAEKIRKAQQ